MSKLFASLTTRSGAVFMAMLIYGSTAQAATPLFEGGPATIDWDDQLTALKAKAPAPYVPFALVDPATGVSLAADAIVSGTNTTAAAYYGELNSYEQKINKIGYSLRDSASSTAVAQAKVNLDAIVAAANAQTKMNLDFDPKIMDAVQNVISLEGAATTAALDAEDKILRSFEVLASSNDPDGFQVRLGPLDQKAIKTPQLTNISSNIHREWSFGPQQPDQVYVAGKAVFNLDAEKTKASGLASVDVNGRLLSQDINLLYGEVSANADLTLTPSAATASLNAEVYLNALGYERYRWPPRDNPGAGKAAYTAEIPDLGFNDKAGDGPSDGPLNAWLKVTRESLNLEPWAWDMKESYAWYFQIGPVPANGHIGIDGSADIDWGSGINVSGAKANLTFGASVKVWADAGIGVPGVASAGGIADLVLLDNRFNFAGSSRFMLGDGDGDGDGGSGADLVGALTHAVTKQTRLEPKVVSEFKATRTLTFLKGKAGAYWEILTPTASPPFLEPKRHEYIVFDWDGYSNSGTIFSYKKICSLGSYDVFGAPSGDDLQSAQLDQSLDDHFNAVLADADNHTRVMADIRDVSSRQAQTRIDFQNLIDGFRN